MHRLIGLLLIAIALGVGLSYRPDRPVETLVARWGERPSQFIEVRGQFMHPLVHLRDVGPRDDPAPLLLLHGTGASLHTWEGWSRALRAKRRIVTVDLPGFGLTGPSADGDYRSERLAGFVLDLMDQLKLSRVVIGGNSLGGEVAWRVAHRAPERVAKLVLVDATGYAFVPESVPIGFRIATLPGMGWWFENLTPRAVVAATLRDVLGDPSRLSEAQVDRYHELLLRQGNRAALVRRLATQIDEFSHEADAVARIKALRVPTLVLWGGRDRLIPSTYAKRFAADIPSSRLVVFDDLGHIPQEEDPARTAAEVAAFLAAP